MGAMTCAANRIQINPTTDHHGAWAELSCTPDPDGHAISTNIGFQMQLGSFGGIWDFGPVATFPPTTTAPDLALDLASATTTRLTFKPTQPISLTQPFKMRFYFVLRSGGGMDPHPPCQPLRNLDD